MSRVLTALAALLLLAPALVAQDNPGPTEPAFLNVKVPSGARLLIGDHLTRQTGEMRRFVTPALALDKSYSYSLKATFKDREGKEVTVEDTVRVTGGKTTEVDLTKPKAEAKKAGGDEKAKADEKKTGGEEKPKRPPDVIFVGTPPEVVDEMIKVADIKKSDLLYDLGCGDGIIVVTASKKVGCKSVGYDIDPKRVKEAKEKAKEAKVEDLVTIEEKDIFTLDLTKATVIATYLLDDLNKKLVAQFKQMKDGSRIVMHDYDIPGYKPDKTTKVTVNGREHRVFLYTLPLKKEK
jgi:uncharacterized protein (TIGR03000 family)